MTRSRRPRSPISSGTCSPTGPHKARPSTGPFASSREPARAERSSWSPTRCSSSSAAGRSPRRSSLVCPSVERQRAQLETALGALGVPYAIEGRIRIGKTAFGQALLSLLRFEWLAGGRHDLYGFLRSPFSGLARAHVDYLEGRLRGRAVTDPARVVEETLKLRGQPLRCSIRSGPTAEPLEAVRALARAMIRAAYGLESPPVGEDAALDLRAHRAVTRPRRRARGLARAGRRSLP